ncbi:hypothetical protein SteCoe_17218 [Stentor coeruleus]|uniref:Uncharacterized protein n=1 Tax=Stentor coeruleus TaxID=5963 RepID=A0A1R2BZD3_9CILI|nr:hypothetical protein SteCoe_17218 [Stentor coeruleus]
MNQRYLKETWMRLETALGDDTKRAQSHRISKRIINTSRLPSFRSNSASNKTIKEPVSVNQLKNIYKAKCDDMRIPVLPDQESRFITFCVNNFKNRHFHMKEAGLSLQSAYVIGKVLKTSNFAYVDLSKNSLGSEGIFVLLKEISDSQTIVHLNLSNNEIIPEGFDNIAKILSYHPSIVSIDFSSYEGLHRNRLSSCGAMSICQVLNSNPLLQFLGLSGTGLSDGIEFIAQGITENYNLFSLDLSNNALNGKMMECLTRAVVKTELKILNLSNNKIGDEGCEFISNMILGAYEAACPLVNLNISYNGISSKGAGKIFHSLRLNILIKDFNISGNQFSQGLTMFFTTFLSDNCVMKNINLSNCGIKTDHLQNVLDGLNKNKKLENINLSHNKIEDPGAQHIAFGLAKNTGLKSIDLSSCSIKGQGALAIAKSLRNNFTLNSINLRDNSVKDDSGEIFVEITRLNKNFLSINLDLNPLNLKFVESIKLNLKENRRSHKKQRIPKIRQEIENMRIPIEAYENLNKKARMRLEKKAEIERRHEIHDESFEEVKEKEHKKTQAIIQEHKILREKNIELALSIDASQSETIKTRVQNERKIEELHLKLRIADIEIDKIEKKLNSTKEANEIKKKTVNSALAVYRDKYQEEEMGRRAIERNLTSLKSLLDENKRQVESLKTCKTITHLKPLKPKRIPAEFLASEKLAMNKKKYSPKKKQKPLIKTQRSSSATK